MFIIAGVSPKIKVIDTNPRLCPSCGLAQAYLKRADSYFSFFFIPLFCVKKGEPFLYCERCQSAVSRQETLLHTWKNRDDFRCKNCGKTIEAGFSYCPYCGKPV